MAGFDFTTSIEALGGLGLWGEIGLFIPERGIDFSIDYGAEADTALLSSLYGRALPCNDHC
jgi:hypothetical protein